jgi:two-component system, NarL family, sensor histidine kinase DegS
MTIDMDPTIKPSSRKTDDIITNPHFWAIVVICIALSFIYYDTVIFFTPKFPWFINIYLLELRHNVRGILYIIPFLYASIIFGYTRNLVAWILSMVVLLPWVVCLYLDPMFLARDLLILFTPTLIAVFITLQLRWMNNERKTSVERETERQAYTSQILKAQEDERQRIAQELHDDTVQTLLVTAGYADSIASNNPPKDLSKVKKDAEWIRDTILRVSDDMRRLSLDLRPSILDNIGLVPALRWLVDNLNQEEGIETKVIISGENRKLKPEIDVMIFRIVQEALNNARRHSKASVVEIAVEFTAESFIVSVKDNGLGFSLPQTTSVLTAEGKMGLIGMQQRSQSINGVLKIQSELGVGTNLSLEVKT